MAEQTTINKIKIDRRISHNALDSDISDQIDSCLADLRVCGIQDPLETDPMILKAIKLYCRADFEDDSNKAAAYLQRYDNLKACLMMAEGYGHAN